MQANKRLHKILSESDLSIRCKRYDYTLKYNASHPHHLSFTIYHGP